MKKRELYKLEGDKLVRLRKYCPKCGDGVFLAEHKDRLSCGNCGYTEFKGGGRKTPEKPLKEEKPEIEPEEKQEVSKPKEEQASPEVREEEKEEETSESKPETPSVEESKTEESKEDTPKEGENKQ